MNLRAEFSMRAFVVYLACFGAAWILSMVVWGATVGVVGGLSIGLDAEYQQQIVSFLQERGVDPDASDSEVRNVYNNLSEEDQQELEAINDTFLSNINWFLVTALASVVLFGFVGFLGGLFSKAWLLAGAVPALSLVVSNSILKFPTAKDLPVFDKVAVIGGAVTRFVSVKVADSPVGVADPVNVVSDY